MTDPTSARRRQKGLAVSFVDSDPASINSSPVISISSAHTTPSTSPLLRDGDDKNRDRFARALYPQRKHSLPTVNAASTSNVSGPSGKPASPQGLEAAIPVMDNLAAGPSDAKRWSVPYDASDGDEVQVHIHTPARRHGRGSPSPSRRGE